ncbi:MAG: hypothetical protein ABGZ17_16005 [Planctomycetaceae bacterium]
MISLHKQTLVFALVSLAQTTWDSPRAVSDETPNRQTARVATVAMHSELGDHG